VLPEKGKHLVKHDHDNIIGWRVQLRFQRPAHISEDPHSHEHRRRDPLNKRILKTTMSQRKGFVGGSSHAPVRLVDDEIQLHQPNEGGLMFPLPARCVHEPVDRGHQLLTGEKYGVLQ